MRRSMKSIRRDLVIGISGACLPLLLGRALAPILTAHLAPAATQAVNIAIFYSMVIVPLAVLLHQKEPLSNYGLTAGQLPRQILIGIVIGLCMSIVLALLPMLLGLKQLVYTGSGFHHAGDALLRLVYFIAVVGLVEEFLFRGYVLHKLEAICLSDGAPILISSLLFGLFHLKGFNFSQVLTTALIGTFFCICQKRIPACSLLSLAIAHGLHDWLIRFWATVLQ